MMVDARKLAMPFQEALKRDEFVTILGKLDIRLVAHLLKLGHHLEETKFDSTQEILQVLVVSC